MGHSDPALRGERDKTTNMNIILLVIGAVSLLIPVMCHNDGHQHDTHHPNPHHDDHHQQRREAEPHHGHHHHHHGYYVPHHHSHLHGGYVGHHGHGHYHVKREVKPHMFYPEH